MSKKVEVSALFIGAKIFNLKKSTITPINDQNTDSVGHPQKGGNRLQVAELSKVTIHEAKAGQGTLDNLATMIINESRPDKMVLELNKDIITDERQARSDMHTYNTGVKVTLEEYIRILTEELKFVNQVIDNNIEIAQQSLDLTLR